MLCFFIVSNERDEIRPPMKKEPYKVMKTMIKKKRWDKIDSFIKPIPANGKNTKEHLKKKTTNSKKRFNLFGKKISSISSGFSERMLHDDEGTSSDKGSSS